MQLEEVKEGESESQVISNSKIALSWQSDLVITENTSQEIVARVPFVMTPNSSEILTQ